MNDSFMGNCCNADQCLNFINCEHDWYTPKRYNHETLPPADWCNKQDKLVFVRPYTVMDWAILEKQYTTCTGVNLDDETVLVQEAI